MDLATALISALVSATSGPGSLNHMNRVLNERGKSQTRRVKRLSSSGLGGYNPTNRSDLLLKPPTIFNVPRSVPRNWTIQPHFDSVKINSTITPVNGSVVETNFSFSLSAHPQASNWTALFDQFSIVQATVEFDSQIPQAATGIPPVLYTALDFDNAAAISTVQALEDFSSSEARPKCRCPCHAFCSTLS